MTDSNRQRRACADRRRKWLGLLVLVLAIAIGSWSRIVQVRNIELLDADATIAYLQSAGHAGQDWADAIDGPSKLTERWVEASEWKALFAGEFPPPLARIWRDHSLDVHPPLYSVALGMWRAWFGQGMHTGILFNVPVAVATILAIFVLALMVTNDHLGAALAAALYAVMPATVGGISTTARMYELLAMWTVLLAILVLHYMRAEGRGAREATIGIALVSALGLLTHSLYSMSLVMAAAWIVAGCGVLYGLRASRARITRGVGAVIAGAALAAAAYPSLASAPARVLAMGGEYIAVASSGDGPARFRWLVGMVADGVLGVYTLRWLAMQAGPVVSVAAVALALCVAALLHASAQRAQRTSHQSQPARSERDERQSRVLALALGSAAVIPLAVVVWGFLTDRIPYFAPKYLAQSLPFIALMPWLVTRRIPRPLATMATAAYVGLLGLAAFLSCLPGGIPEPNVRPAAELADASTVVVDTSDMSYLPKVLILLDDTTMVFASESQASLMANRATWQTRVGVGTHYVSFPIHENTYEGGAAVAGALAGSLEVTPLSLMPQGNVVAPDTATLWTVR